MRLSVEELARLVRLKGRDQILLCLAAHTRPQWWATAAELAGVAGVHPRRARLALVALAREGLLDRKGETGGGSGNVARFRVASKGDQSDPVEPDQSDPVSGSLRSGSDPPPTRRTRAGDHAQQKETSEPSDPSSFVSASSLGSASDRSHHRPSVLGDRRGDGRTEGEIDQRLQTAVEWVHERLGVTSQMSTPGLLRLLNAGASDRELRAYALDQKRGIGPAFDGLEHARFRFGAACTEDRFELWRRARAARVRAEAERAKTEAFEHVEPSKRAPKAVSQVSAREMENFVRTMLRR